MKLWVIHLSLYWDLILLQYSLELVTSLRTYIIYHYTSIFSLKSNNVVDLIVFDNYCLPSFVIKHQTMEPTGYSNMDDIL
jgi:hypothetical protein